jgi:hypothetical protein
MRLCGAGEGVRLRQRRTSQAITAAKNGAARTAIISGFGFLLANARCYLNNLDIAPYSMNSAGIIPAECLI